MFVFASQFLENGFSRLGPCVHVRRRASHKSRGITHQTPPTFDGNHESWPRIRERGREYENGPVPFPSPGLEKKKGYRQRRRGGKRDYRRNRRAEFQNEERAVVGQWEGKQFPTVLDQAGRRGRRSRRRESQREGGSQLSGNVSSIPPSFLLETDSRASVVTYHSKSMRTNLSPSSSDFNRIE